jgi:hypothetical protein
MANGCRSVIDGALATHPVAGSHGHYSPNPFYDPMTTRIAAVDDTDVLTRLETRPVARRVAPTGTTGRRYNAWSLMKDAHCDLLEQTGSLRLVDAATHRPRRGIVQRVLRTL